MTNAIAGGSNTHEARVEPEKVQQDEKAAGSSSQGSPSSPENGSSASPMTGGRHSARAHAAGTGIVTVGVVTILISAWGALIPFVEPLFGYHVTGTPSWHWNAAHTLLAVVPGAVGERRFRMPQEATPDPAGSSIFARDNLTDSVLQMPLQCLFRQLDRRARAHANTVAAVSPFWYPLAVAWIKLAAP